MRGATALGRGLSPLCWAEQNPARRGARRSLVLSRESVTAAMVGNAVAL